MEFQTILPFASDLNVLLRNGNGCFLPRAFIHSWIKEH